MEKVYNLPLYVLNDLCFPILWLYRYNKRRRITRFRRINTTVT